MHVFEFPAAKVSGLEYQVKVMFVPSRDYNACKFIQNLWPEVCFGISILNWPLTLMGESALLNPLKMLANVMSNHCTRFNT